jgi:hypothetical protein
MALQILTDGTVYYTRGLTRTGCLCWSPRGDQWERDMAEPPPEARAVSLQDLPAALQEEVLAFAARSEVIAGPSWDLRN